MSIPALNTALYSLLAGTVTAAGSAIYYLQAPDNKALPFVVFDYVSDLDENMTPNRTKNVVVFVRAYASTPGAAGTIDAQIDTLLHLQTLTVTGWSNFWSAREMSHSLVETDAAGVKTYMSGGEFRIRLDKS